MIETYLTTFRHRILSKGKAMLELAFFRIEMPKYLRVSDSFGRIVLKKSRLGGSGPILRNNASIGISYLESLMRQHAPL